VLSVLRQPAVAWFFASIFFTVLAHTSLYTFFSLFLDAQGMGKSTVGALWAVSVAAEIAFFWWQGRFFGRLQAHAWLQWAAAVSVLRFVAIAALGAHLVVLVLAQALHAVTFAAQHAACISLIARHFPGSLRGRGQALYTVLGYGLSGVVGGVAGGWLSTKFGFQAVFWAASGAAALGWWCATRSRRSDLAAARDPAHAA
jgi:PPP family 3-phenylpropionic acid transporter